MSLSLEESAELVTAAARGDYNAWERLVDAYAEMIWAVGRSYRLNDSDIADVCQTTWLRLLENINRLHDPGRVGAWLTTTARRECLRLLNRYQRLVLTVDENRLAVGTDRIAFPEPDSAVLLAERRRQVHNAFVTVPHRCRQLLLLLLSEPPPSYEEVAAILEVPVGSVGPTRGRCLDKLRSFLVENAREQGNS